MWWIYLTVLILFGVIYSIIEYYKARTKQQQISNKKLNTKIFTADQLRTKLKSLSRGISVPRKETLADSIDQQKSLIYFCNACSTRTSFSTDYQALLKYTLPWAREKVKTMEGITISIDESQFCNKCNPEAKHPVLSLLIKLPDSQQPHKVTDIHTEDIRLLDEFLRGEKVHTTDFDEEFPLKDYSQRIKYLLNID